MLYPLGIMENLRRILTNYSKYMQNVISSTEMNQMLHIVLDHMMCGVALFEISNTVKPLYYNQGLRDMIADYSKEDMQLFHEDSMFNLFPADADTIRVLLANSMQTGQSFEAEYREYRKNGNGIRHVQFKAAPIPFAKSDKPVYLAIFNDISTQKALQQEVEDERQRYKLALETSNDIVFEYDIAIDMLCFYQGANSMGGRSKKEQYPNFKNLLLAGRFTYPEDTELVQGALCQGKQLLSNVRLCNLDDSQNVFRWYAVRSTLVHQGTVPARVVGTLRNVDEQKLLAGIIDRFVYEACDYFVFIDAINDSYVIYSHSACGTPLPPVEGASYSAEVVNYAHAHVVEQDIEHIIEKMRLDTVLSALDRDGEHIAYAGVKDPKRGYTHKKMRYVYFDKQKKQILLTRIDVTHVYQEEAHKNTLLLEALDAARMASNAKTEFLSRMSHDIRTPLNAIMGMTSIAKHKVHDVDRVQDCLAHIDASSQYLLSLINAILDMAKIESGKLSLTESSFSFETLVSDITAIIQPQALAQHIDFSIGLEQPMTSFVVGDAVRINQIVMNLLSNALKFTPFGGTVSLRIREVLRHQHTVFIEFSVQDSGPGISSAFQKIMFDPFTQEAAGYARNHVGSGLGLSIVKTLVELMDGSIDVESVMEVGTTITVKLPLKILSTDTAQTSPPLKPPCAPLPVAACGRFANLQVLLVEDNEINKEIAQVLLEEEGLRVDCACDGQQALDMFSQSALGTYALILMDIRMPIMDGITATKLLRKMERSDAASIPIIAMTANAFDEDMHMALAAGMTAYLTKPVMPAVLYQEIEEVLKVCNSTF